MVFGGQDTSSTATDQYKGKRDDAQNIGKRPC